MAVLASTLCFLIYVYSTEYMAHEGDRDRFFFLMLAFTVLLPIGILVYAGVRVWRWMRRNSSIGSSQAVEENAPGDPAG